MRARHQLFDSPPILDDPVVLKLVPEARDPSVLSDFGDMAALARTLLAVRSRFTEDRLAQAAARGVGQYVMFGLVSIPSLGGSRILLGTCRFLQSTTPRA